MQDYEALRTQIADVHDTLLERVEASMPASEAQALLSSVMPPATTDVVETHTAVHVPGTASFELIDLRLALVQLAFATGSNDQLSVVRAQSQETPRVIAVQNGMGTLAGLRDWIADQDTASDLMTADILNVPLVILPMARFDMHPGDVLDLSTPGGAFILNLGGLIVDGATIKATAEKNIQVPDFAPFVATVGTGQAQISHTEFSGLGFGETAVFSGVSVINRGLYQPIGPSHLTDSTLRNTLSATFEGGAALKIARNVFAGHRTGGVSLRGTQDAEVLSNIFLGARETPAVSVTDGTLNAMLSHNIILDGRAGGIAVSQGSHATTIHDTLVWQSAGAGISVRRSDCVTLTGNIIIDGAQKGIDLRTSRNSQIISNQLLGSRSAGLFIGDQPVGTQTQVRDNLFLGNRFGLSSASADQLMLSGNDFQNQFPRFLEGDLASQSPKIVSSLRGARPIELQSGGIEMFNISRLTCQT